MQDLLTGRRRFPEFAAEPWDEASLGELFDERNERDCRTLPLLAVTSDRGIIPREEVGRKDTSNSDKSAYKRVRPGDIAYNTMRMWQGVSALSDLDGIVSPAYTVVTPKDRMLGTYAQHLLKLPRTVHEFLRRSQGLVDDTLSLKFPNFAKVRVRYPRDQAEQQAISDLLGQLDGEIVCLTQQSGAFGEFKRGLMQKLLSGDIEVPQGLGTLDRGPDHDGDKRHDDS
jgi:type I restriction enzyme S subunit